MIHIEKITTSALDLIVDYLLENQNNIGKVISDFGEVSMENGYGTFFLKPKNPLFKIFSIHTVQNKVSSVRFGAPNLGFTFKDLLAEYQLRDMQYIPHDSWYQYVFQKKKNIPFCLTITDEKKLNLDAEIKNHKAINIIEIILLT